MSSPTVRATSPLRCIPVPRRLTVPTAAPSLAPGAEVAAGESLVESRDGAAHVALAPVHARIVETERITLLNNRQVDGIVIETLDEPTGETGDGVSSEPAPLEANAIAEWLDALPPDALGAQIDRLRNAGVWADRWTSPDLLGQLHQSLRRPIDTVICTLLDADPSLPINQVCAEEHAAEVVAAVLALGKLTGAIRFWIVVDENGPSSLWSAVRAAVGAMATPGSAGAMRIVPLVNDYPQADPTLLLYSLSRRRLAPGRLPTEQGVLLFDAAAAVAVTRALVGGAPMLRVPFAVYEQAHDRTHLLDVPIGCRLGAVLEHLRIPRHGLDLRAGGPLREMRVGWDHVIAGTELGVYAVPREPDVNPDPCVRCGWCIEGCPVSIHPAMILQAAQESDLALAETYGLSACIECGICSYVCPSHLPLLHGVRVLRNEPTGPVDEGV